MLNRLSLQVKTSLSLNWVLIKRLDISLTGIFTSKLEASNLMESIGFNDESSNIITLDILVPGGSGI